MFNHQLSGLKLWKKNKDLVFTAANGEFAHMLGFNNPSQMMGKTDYDIPSRFADCAEIFRKNDLDVMQNHKTMKFLEIQQDAKNNWLVLFVVKSPCIENKNIIGTEGYCVDITSSFHKLNHSLIEPKSHLIDSTIPYLTKRETECLFLLLRGKTAREIGSILFLSHRTVEGRIEKIRFKFNCQTKSELISFALEQGYGSIIPESFFNQQLSLFLE